MCSLEAIVCDFCMRYPIILKLGGSLVVPKDIDVRYLKRFVNLIKRQVKRGKRFIIIVGGGYTNRWYRDRAKELGVKNATDLHWIGTISTRLNAEFVRTLFEKLAHPRPYWDFSEPIRWRKPVLVVGGDKPGHSTDYDAVLMARKFNAKTVINVTNVPMLYTKDPKKYRDAKPIREILWKEYRAMFGNPKAHLPGQNIPIDAVAALNSQKHKLETFYVGGKDLKNLDHLLSGVVGRSKASPSPLAPLRGAARKWQGTRIY